MTAFESSSSGAFVLEGRLSRTKCNRGYLSHISFLLNEEREGGEYNALSLDFSTTCVSSAIRQGM